MIRALMMSEGKGPRGGNYCCRVMEGDVMEEYIWVLKFK